MAVVRGYDPQVSPAGQLTSRADANDFGAAIGNTLKEVARSELELGDAAQRQGRALGDAGVQLASVAKQLYETEAQDEVSAVHTTMAELRAKNYQRVNDIVNNTQPGDQTLIPRIQEALKSDFNEIGSKFTTPAAKKLFANETTNMLSESTAHGVQAQAGLDGKFAVNQYNTLTDTYGRIVSENNQQLDGSIQRVTAAIDDKNGIFSRVTQATRDELKQKAIDDLTLMAARGFVRRHPGVVSESLPDKLRDKLRDQAANPPTPGLPPNLGADTVKPYTPGKISHIANKVEALSPYDDTFKAAANKYGLDWRELKMRSAAESDIKDIGENSAGAGGIMQMTKEMASDLGVNRFDPTEAIFGAARVLSKYQAKAGGDMAKVDMMYYGGESGKAWGPNTKQYAANLAAVRQTAGIGGTQSPESFANSGYKESDWKSVKTGFDVIDRLPPEKRFQVLQENDHYEAAARAEQNRAKEEQHRLDVEQKSAAASGILDRIVNPNDANGGKITESDIINSPLLGNNWEMKRSLIQFQTAYEKEQNRETKDHPAAFNSLIDRIYADDTDPNKIYSMDPIIKAFNARDISYPEFSRLQKEVLELKDGSTNGFRKDFNSAVGITQEMFTRSISGQIDPASAAAATFKFRQWAEGQVQTKRKNGEDPTELLNPNSKDYLMSPENLQRFMPAISMTTASAAKETVKTAASNANRVAEAGLSIGNTYQDKSGKQKIYLGGPKTDPASWQDIDPTRD